jgi:hypothetical protein
MPNINDNGGGFYTGSLHVGAINGFALYQALITQAGTAAPTVVILYSNLSAAIVWTRTSAGLYVGTLTGEFTSNKTGIFINGDTGSPEAIITAKAVSANAVNIKTYLTTGTPALADDLLAGAYLEIIIAP